MNAINFKRNLKIFFVILMIGLFNNEMLFAKSAEQAFVSADFVAPIPEKPMPVSEIINFFFKKQKKTKLTANEAQILKLSQLAKDVFGIKEFFVAESLTTEKQKVEAITLSYVANTIQERIRSKLNWDESLSSSNLEKVKQSRQFLKETLKGTLADSSYIEAWINYKSGLKLEAKNILSEKFENGYKNVMQMKEIYNHDSNPLNESESLFKILKPMSNEKEKKSLEDRLKKMRTHISQLPEMQIMT